ncbi:MAG TPA: hypothetical protein VGF97_06775 [Rhizomicrobium sp.]|jgi:hypothetical protein
MGKLNANASSIPCSIFIPLGPFLGDYPAVDLGCQLPYRKFRQAALALLFFGLLMPVKSLANNFAQNELPSVKFAAEPGAMSLVENIPVFNLPIQIDRSLPAAPSIVVSFRDKHLSSRIFHVSPNNRSGRHEEFPDTEWVGRLFEKVAGEAAANEDRGSLAVILEDDSEGLVSGYIESFRIAAFRILEKNIGPLQIHKCPLGNSNCLFRESSLPDARADERNGEQRENAGEQIYGFVHSPNPKGFWLWLLGWGYGLGIVLTILILWLAGAFRK